MSTTTSVEANTVVNDAPLRAGGFTESGVQQFRQTVLDYAKQLHERATRLGDADQADNMPREITHEHVRNAARSLALQPSRSKSPWLVAGHVTEYVATALAGVGGGSLAKEWGIWTFALGVSVAVILVVIRLTHSKGE